MNRNDELAQGAALRAKGTFLSLTVGRFREPALTALVAVEAIWLFVLAPLEQVHVLPSSVNSIVTAVIVCIVLVICSGNRWAEGVVFMTTVLDIVIVLAHAVAPAQVTIGIDLGARIIFLLALVIVVGTAVFGRGRVTHHRILGAIAIELTTALAFAFVYRGIESLAPGAIGITSLRGGPADTTFGRYVYFSFTTLTSTGYGDMVPVHPFARSAANLEALLGQLFPATLLARLVSLEIGSRRDPETLP